MWYCLFGQAWVALHIASVFWSGQCRLCGTPFVTQSPRLPDDHMRRSSLKHRDGRGQFVQSRAAAPF